MSKRFTASDKWTDKWFRRLEAKYKLLWIYILDSCSIAGIWEVDLELAQMFTGFTYQLKEAETILKDRIVLVNDKWFIPKFIDFQYGELSKDCKPHMAVIKELKRYNIEYPKSMDTLKDKDKDKDKVINKDKDKVKVEDCEQYFEDAGYERKLGKVFWGYYNAQSWMTGGEHPRKIDDWTSKAFEIINSPKKLKWLMGLEENNATTKNFGNREFKSKLADEGRGNTGKPFDYITSGSKSDAGS